MPSATLSDTASMTTACSQPRVMTDPNGNRSQVAFDALGLVVGTAVMGKTTETLGDLLDASFEPDPTQSQLDAFMAKPREASPNADESAATPIVHDLLGKATTRIIYDLDRFTTVGRAAFCCHHCARDSRQRIATRASRPKSRSASLTPTASGARSRRRFRLSQGEPQRDANGEIIVGANGQPVMTANDVSPRWVGSGWTIFNNKGKPVRQYEPFFD